MDTYGLIRFLTRFCTGRWYLRGLLDPLYRHAEHRGYKPLMQENARRLLERAHLERLTGQDAAEATAGAALDRFETLAAHGDPEAAFQVAEAHRTGFGRPRNHWKAVEHCRLAVGLGHPAAQARLLQLQGREDVEDAPGVSGARRALLQATYAPRGSEHHVRNLGAWFRDLGLAFGRLRTALLLLTGAGLVLSYLVLDLYFFGMGAWHPDPSRVVWGLFGKIHPPKDDSVTRVLPRWLRPDARSVTFTVHDFNQETWSQLSVAACQGQVVYLQVVDAHHPAVAESIPYLKGLARRQDASFKFFLLLAPALENGDTACGWAQAALDFAPALPAGRKALRPLGAIRTFPMNFVLDRQGCIRQRWTGFSQEVTEAAIKGALAES